MKNKTGARNLLINVQNAEVNDTTGDARDSEAGNQRHFSSKYQPVIFITVPNVAACPYFATFAARKNEGATA